LCFLGEKSAKEEALETLKAMRSASIETAKGPPSRSSDSKLRIMVYGCGCN